MEKIYPGNGFAVIEKDGQYEIEWPVGPFDHIVSYPISKENMEKALRSSRDGYEVKIYAETGEWPQILTEEVERKRAFVRRCPEVLIRVPENQKLFTEEELKVLMVEAKKDIEERILKKK